MDRCVKCGLFIDTENDSYYYCDCGDENKLYCEGCMHKTGSCPECGAPLKYHEPSATEKSFFDPPTRDGLGL